MSFLNKTKSIYFLLLFIFFSSCESELTENKSGFLVSRLNDRLTDVLIADIYTPPVASRIYAYSNLAIYEALSIVNDSMVRYSDVLNGYPIIDIDQIELIDKDVSVIASFSKVAQSLVISADSIRNFTNSLLLKYENKLPKDVYEKSLNVADIIADSIVAYAWKDGYSRLSTMDGYVVGKKDSDWRPTPPAYLPAAEPNWSKLRTFFIDSANQFIPKEPIEFSSEYGSMFYKSAITVYEAVNNATSEDSISAVYWDCNPQTTQFIGHAMMFSQKLTPGGHWIKITSDISRKENLSLSQSATIHSRVAIAIADGFISCWDEKYRSNLIRPETYIIRYIDSKWKPILETPAFPEHTSGHSVVSSVSATILGDFFGYSYSFTDSAEVRFGLDPRSFDSFKDAADAAAISRLLGGIHYEPAIFNGVEQGELIGDFLLKKLD